MDNDGMVLMLVLHRGTCHGCHLTVFSIKYGKVDTLVVDFDVETTRVGLIGTGVKEESRLQRRYGVSCATGPEQSQFSAFCVYRADAEVPEEDAAFEFRHQQHTLVPKLWGATHIGLVGGIYRLWDTGGRPGTMEGQDHEEARFWRRLVGCIRYTDPFTDVCPSNL